MYIVRMMAYITCKHRCNYENLRTCLCNFFMYNMYTPSSFCDVLFVSKIKTILSRQRISCIYDFFFSVCLYKHVYVSVHVRCALPYKDEDAQPRFCKTDPPRL